VSDDRWKLVKGIFLRAAARPAAEWPSYLDAACAGDADLHAEVASLLVEHDPQAADLLGPARGSEVEDPAEQPPALGPPRDEVVPGTFFDEVYYVERELGLEPGGTTYLVRHALAGDQVVLKVFDATVGIDAATSEARVPRLLRHPTLASVFDIRTTRSGRFYLVREWFDGEPVGRLLARGDLGGAPRAIEILRGIAEVFEEAESRGLEGPRVSLDDVFLLQGSVVRLRRLACSPQGLGASLPSTFVPEGARGLATETPESVRDSRRGVECLAGLAAAMLHGNSIVDTLRAEVDAGSPTPLEFVARLAHALAPRGEDGASPDSDVEQTLDLHSDSSAASGEPDGN
jgi:hypothetical protein